MRTWLATLVLIGALASCGQPSASPSDAPASVTPGPTGASASDVPAPTASSDATPTASEEPSPVTPAWARLDGGDPAAAPAAREDHTWVVDGDGSAAYLFGGRDGETVHGDLWAFDLAADRWQPLQPSGPRPEARFGHEAAWVDGLGMVIIFGQVGTTFFNDLWAYDPAANAWRQLPSNGAVPVARYGSCAALGPDGRLWISHGFTAENARFADTLAYDFGSGTWTDETPVGDRPVSRCLHGCWWTDAGALRLYAGQTTGATALGDLWQLEAGERPGANAWRQLTGELPDARNLYARARVGAATLVFGGQALDGGYLGGLYRLDDTADAAVSVEATGEEPSGRSGAELVFDADAGRLLLFGGKGDGGAMSDLWALEGIATD